MGFTDFFISTCEQNPDQLFVQCEEDASTFAEHFNRVCRSAALLRSEYKLAPTDRFAVLSRNSRDYLEMFHASMLGGGIIVPINVRASDEELTSIMVDSGCRVCFASDEFYATAERLRKHTSIEQVALIGTDSDGSYSSQLEHVAPELPRPPQPSETAFLMYTSGTTGKPKGVMISHGALVNDIYKTALPSALGPGYKSLLHAPLYHIASVRGFALAPAIGTTLILLPRFEPKRVIEEAQLHQVDSTGFIASTVRDMLDLPDFNHDGLPSLTSIHYGSAPMHPAVLQRLIDAFPDASLINWYGMTETCGHISALTGPDHRAGKHLNSLGRPLPGNRVRVLDPAGDPVPRGAVGELVVSGDNLMTGYWNKRPLRRDAEGAAWHETGDACYIDADGFIYLTGRTREMIITGGENVAPTEVESVLADHPDVVQSVVLGVPDDKWGEAVHACVCISELSQVTEADLIRHCRRRLAGYKTPKQIYLTRTPFPMAGSNKIDRKRVRTQYLDIRDASSAATEHV